MATLSHNLIFRFLPRQKWLRQHRYYVLKISLNGVSTTFRHASSKIRGQCGNINTESNYRPCFWANILLTTSLLCPKNKHQRSVNNLRPSIIENQGAMRLQWSIIIVRPAFRRKYVYDMIVTISQNKRQQSVNYCSAGILNNLTGMDRR